MTHYAVFYRVRQTLRKKDVNATTDWEHDWIVLQTSDLDRYREFSFRDRITFCLETHLGETYSDYEREITSITVLEIQRGISHLAQRGDESQAAVLARWLDAMVLPAFNSRILPVDTAVAHHCARLHIPDPRPERDALIAATALAHGMTVVTRNTVVPPSLLHSASAG